MASFRNRNGKWQAQVRVSGHAPRSKSFTSKRDATRWARQIEMELEAAALPVDHRVLDRITVRELLERYRREVTPSKRGRASEEKRFDGFLRQTWADKPLSAMTSQVFSKYRDQRLKSVSSGTVIRDLGLLRTVFEVARMEWDLPIPENPVAKVRKPKAPSPRDRRLEKGELERLLEAADTFKGQWLGIGIQLAVETGMRRGELLSIFWDDLCFDSQTLLIRITKNGHTRRIPLTPNAIKLFQDWRHQAGATDDLVFPISANAFRLAWERCKRRVARTYPDIADLRFHDLRHEAVSRLFEMGLSVPEVALVSGHRDPRMLFRYTHLRAEDLSSKLRTLSQGGV